MKKEPEVAYAELLAEMPHILRIITVNCQLHKHKYDELRMQGFTEAQAIELCKVVP